MEKVLYMILKDGTSSGIVESRLGMNNGICYKIPRTRLTEASSLSGINNNGIYILFGDDTATSKKIAYIGKSSTIINRLKTHKATKDYWNEVLVFVTENNVLNQAHISYIEYKLCEEAKRVNKDKNNYTIMNDQKPQDPNITEAEKINAKEFIDMIKLFVSVMKYDLFDAYKKEKSDSNILYLTIGGEELGKAMSIDEGFLVLKGSKIRLTNHKIPDTLQKKYNEEINSPDIQDGIYVNDHLFKSSSIAALVLSGTSINGREYWKTKDGRTLKKIEEEK